MRKILFILLLSSLNLFSQIYEHRGVWYVPRNGNAYKTKSEIASDMDIIARNNFNAVYVLVWARGYPLFRSEVFYKDTGLYTDPQLGDRDLLQEMIAEAHRAGLEVYAWFEYGFIGGWGGYLPGTSGKGKIFDTHPEWLAKRSDGSDTGSSEDQVNYNFYWMAHANPEVQNFLIQLILEMVKNYDIDGFELDRIRYPDPNCGYDSVTVELYKQEHNGTPPPLNYNDPEWKNWRIQKLNQFAKTVYDSVKFYRKDMRLTNAVGVGPDWAKNEKLQDWVTWINNGWLDYIEPMNYRRTANEFINECVNIFGRVNDKNKILFGIDSQNPTTSEFLKMIQYVRQQNLKGFVVWYYGSLSDDFDSLRTLLNQKALVPDRPQNWRMPAIIIDDSDSINVSYSNGWNTASSYLHWGEKYLLTQSTSPQWVEYYAQIPQDGYYEVYALVVRSTSDSAVYYVYDSFGNEKKFTVNQTNPTIYNGWYKLGDFYFKSGKQKILKITNEKFKTPGFMTADAVMLILNRRLTPITSSIKDGRSEILPQNFEITIFPNPFNSSTTINVFLPVDSFLKIDIYNTLGQLVKNLTSGNYKAGENRFLFAPEALASGIYILRVRITPKENLKSQTLIKKIALIK
ncbi:family 10 glycosylhydrolase [Candidatus Chrysopegis kryptomonas]|uniref:Por secretion system C-terminal sorting domain-containing protein n=1 Tax=Candidatus Chryseopegocella kryptomonas TaxID=1633643 RepID=A0A0P1MRC3_9BACT|nr:family 10 glycosylhydrolase [Candidatus Chrysopegis kryptomonas]CUS97888.1 Por secretion system C-terminal sorting domain-containing protein [Candidatus Chrysopegis kryptomonas]